MSSTQNNDHRNPETSQTHGDAANTSRASNQPQHQQKLQQHQQQMQQHMWHMQQKQQEMENIKMIQKYSEMPPASKRRLYAIEEQLEAEQSQDRLKGEAADFAYDADVDEDAPIKSSVAATMIAAEKQRVGDTVACEKVDDDKQHIYELFQPWALKTYGDLAKTKTITMRKKVRILKALEGKEHSRPDSSKFRFWVKTKGFTTKRPDSFEDAPCTRRPNKPLPSDAVLSENPADVDLYVASTIKDLEKRTYRKVAVVEEFFDIIFQIHMELGGRSGMHAGQKRTYRIISETYAFLPREAVTRFLSICPECKKNLRPSSPHAQNVKEELSTVIQNESSSEIEVLNYSSHTESSLEAGPPTKTSTKTKFLATGTGASRPAQVPTKKRRYSNPDNNSKTFVSPLEQVDVSSQSLPRRNSSPLIDPVVTQLPMPLVHSQPKIRINPHLQRPFTPPMPDATAFAQPHHGHGFDFHSLKSRDNLMRYYEFMRRLYSGNLIMPQTISNPSDLSKQVFQTLNIPKVTNTSIAVTQSLAKGFEQSISSSSDEESDNVTVLTAKRFKISTGEVDKTNVLESLSSQLHIPSVDKDFIQSTQIRAINLSKNSSHFSSQGKAITEEFVAAPATESPKTVRSAPLTSTPNTVKQEAVTPPKLTGLAALRIPQIHSLAGMPPLDFERLKPITSTYLQLTRSMGLSDEEALRFDNLVSKDFKYSL